MAVTWLHVSDFHLSDKGPYNQEVILRSLVESVRRYREVENRAPDLLFATGDIAGKGNAREYERATVFFDDLLDAAGLNRDRLFVVPGNHDVDRISGKHQLRTLADSDEADDYFDPAKSLPLSHLVYKFQAFSEWYNDYFKTIRTFPTNTTCSPVEIVTINGHRIAVLPLNSAIFCINDHDHEKLFIGRRCLDAARKQLEAADLTIALIHHPLDWLSPIEQSNIEAKLEASVDLLLQGHYHQTSTKSIVSANGGYLKLAAGAAYQTGSWSKAAMYVTFDGSGVTIFPIRYEDRPKETWTLDTSLYPSPDYTERFEIQGKDASCQLGSSPLSACNTAMCDGSGLTVKKSYERYGEALINLFSQFAPPEVGDYPDIEIPLAEVFVDLDISEQNDKVDDRDKGHDGKTKTLKQDALLQEIFHGNARTRVLLLIGDPGSGKTTLLQHYAMLCLEGSHGRLFPEADCVRVVFIELRNLIYDDRNRPVPLAEQIVGIYSALGLSADDVGLWWREMGKTESILVLLDGLDEVTELEKRQAICRWIDDEGHAYWHRFFIVTTRRTGYVTSDGVVLQRKHREAILNDLDVGQQRDFMLKWFRAAAKFTKERGFTIHDNTSSEDKAKELYNYLYPEEDGRGEEKNTEEAGKKKKGLQEIACIPLLLKMMALLYQLRRFKPDSRIDLYKVVTDYLLHGRDNVRQISYGIAPEQSARVLALLAYTMHIEMRLDHSEGRMKEIMESRFQSLNTKVGLDTFFSFMVNRSGMLKPYGNAYRFWHKTFQEYLASREMVRCSRSDDFIRSIVQHYDDRKWEWDETLRFYFAQIDADVFDSFMEQLFDPEITTDVLQRKLQLMKTLIRESPECSTGALCRKLKEPQLSLGVQWYVLDCLEVINKPAALDAVLDFHDRVIELSADDEVVRQRVLDKAVGIIEQLKPVAGINRDLPPGEEKYPGHDNLSEQPPRIISNRYEHDAQYILIRKGAYISYETEEQHAVERDLYVARYPVTNRQYQLFIDFLAGKLLMSDKSLVLQSYQAALNALARSNDDALKGFKEYLNQEDDWVKLFRSRLDDNRKYNKEHQPVVGVSWYAARAYCLWLSMLDGKLPEYRLPTEIEWEWAAGGKREESEKDKVQKTRKYPWGDNPEPTEKHANYKENVGATTDVGSYPDGATPEGLYDMAGNVWEWTNSWYDDDNNWRALRGGSWFLTVVDLRCSARSDFYPDDWDYDVGFRVVRPGPFS